MDATGNWSFEELHELRMNIQNGLDKMLAFNNRLSRFDKRTLKLFITLTSDHRKYEETLKRLEDLEKTL